MDLLNKVYQSQRSYFQSGETLPVGVRLLKLKQFRRVLFEKERKLYEALKKDLNKPVLEAFMGEFMGMLHEVDTAISKLKKWSKRRRIKSSVFTIPSKASVIPEPYGQVLIISPWNYPVDLCLSPLIGAIAAGNVAMVKPSRFTPHTAQVIKEFIAEVFEDKYVSVQNDIDGKTLLQFRYDYIFFTGSVSVGKEVMKTASENLTPVTLELGGKCPVIISTNYNIKKAAKSVAWGKFFNAGQSCVAPDYVFLHKDDLDAFVSAFNFYTKQFLKNPESDYTRIVNQKHFERLLAYLKQGKILAGGDCFVENLQISPTVLLPESMDTPVMQDEIFGPVLPVVLYEQPEEIVRFINSREKALVVYIFSDNKKEQQYFVRHTSSGNVCINDTLLNYVNKNLPFGGVGHSGMGKYHGKASFEIFSNLKSVHRKLSPDFPFRYPPYNKQYKRLWRIKKILNKNI